MEETVLTITLELPKDVCKMVKSLQKEYVGVRAVDNPHITLYLSKFPMRSFLKLGESLSEADLGKRFACTISSLSQQKKNNTHKFFAWHLKDDRRVKALHKQTLLIANSYRQDLIRNKDLQRIEAGHYTKNQITMLKRYGSTLVSSKFKAHITLGTGPSQLGKNKTFLNKCRKLNNIIVPVTAIKVALCRYNTPRDSY